MRKNILKMLLAFSFCLTMLMSLGFKSYAFNPDNGKVIFWNKPALVGDNISEINFHSADGDYIENVTWSKLVSDELVPAGETFDNESTYAVTLTLVMNGKECTTDHWFELQDSTGSWGEPYCYQEDDELDSWVYDGDNHDRVQVTFVVGQANDTPVLDLDFYYLDNGTYKKISNRDLFKVGNDWSKIKVGTSPDDNNGKCYLWDAEDCDPEITSSRPMVKSGESVYFEIEYDCDSKPNVVELNDVILDDGSDRGYIPTNGFYENCSYWAYCTDDMLEHGDKLYIAYVDVLEPEIPEIEILGADITRDPHDENPYVKIKFDSNTDCAGIFPYVIKGDYTNDTEYIDYCISTYQLPPCEYDEEGYVYAPIYNYGPEDFNYNGLYTLILAPYVPEEDYDIYEGVTKSQFLYTTKTFTIDDYKEFKHKYLVVPIEFAESSAAKYPDFVQNNRIEFSVLNDLLETGETITIFKTGTGIDTNWMFYEYEDSHLTHIKDIFNSDNEFFEIDALPNFTMSKFLTQGGHHVFAHDCFENEISIYGTSDSEFYEYPYDDLPYVVLKLAEDESGMLVAYQSGEIYYLTDIDYSEIATYNPQSGYGIHSINVKSGIRDNVFFVDENENRILYDSIKCVEFENVESLEDLFASSIMNLTFKGTNEKGEEIPISFERYEVEKILNTASLDPCYSQLDFAFTGGSIVVVFKFYANGDEFYRYFELSDCNKEFVFTVGNVSDDLDFGTLLSNLNSRLQSFPSPKPTFKQIVSASPLYILAIDEALDEGFATSTIKDKDFTVTCLLTTSGVYDDFDYLNIEGQGYSNITIKQLIDDDTFNPASSDLIPILQKGFTNASDPEKEAAINYCKKIEDDSCIVDEENGLTMLVVKFKLTAKKEEPKSSGSKSYKAKDEDKTAEKISGSGKKGSKRTITPQEGRKVSSVVVKDKNGNKVDVTLNADGTYSFIQPASDVTVEVNYKNREIVLNIGSTDAYVDDELNKLDVTPVIRNDRTMLPIRFVAENLGAKVEWNEKNPNYVLITKGDIKIEVTLGSDKMLVNGKEVKLDSVAFAENDRTYLPVRAVSENLNAIVEWNEAKPMEVKIFER